MYTISPPLQLNFHSSHTTHTFISTQLYPDTIAKEIHGCTHVHTYMDNNNNNNNNKKYNIYIYIYILYIINKSVIGYIHLVFGDNT